MRTSEELKDMARQVWEERRKLREAREAAVTCALTDVLERMIVDTLANGAVELKGYVNDLPGYLEGETGVRLTHEEVKTRMGAILRSTGYAFYSTTGSDTFTVRW
jgi:hypothetical protein